MNPKTDIVGNDSTYSSYFFSFIEESSVQNTYKFIVYENF